MHTNRGFLWINLKKIQKKLITFRDEREWQKFHTPKNLAIDISVEAGELLARGSSKKYTEL